MGLLKRLFGGSSSEPARTPSVPQRSAQSTAAPELPAPAEGFTWHRFAEANLAVLCPDGWFLHQVNTPQVFNGFVSKESIPAKGQFETGLTVRAFRGLNQGLGKDDPEVVIISVVQRLYAGLFDGSQNQVLYVDPIVQRTATSRLLRLQVRQTAPGRPPILIHKFLIVFDQSRDLYDFTFESPEKSWDESWKLGQQILAKLILTVDPAANLEFSADPPLPAEDVIVQKTLDVAQTLGRRLVYENRPEGLFVWRFEIGKPKGKGARPLGGYCSWYMKRVLNELWVDDPIVFDMTVPESMERMEEVGASASQLQEEFKRRWLAAIGPVTLRGPNPETHSPDLQMEVMTELSLGKSNESPKN